MSALVSKSLLQMHLRNRAAGVSLSARVVVREQETRRESPAKRFGYAIKAYELREQPTVPSLIPT